MQSLNVNEGNETFLTYVWHGCSQWFEWISLIDNGSDTLQSASSTLLRATANRGGCAFTLSSVNKMVVMTIWEL